MKDIQSLKCCLRSEGREFRSRLVPEKKLSFDRSIHRHFLALKEYRLADTVFTYVSIKREIDTFAIISAALADGKKVAVPLCIPEISTMKFYEISSLRDLASGYCGILEPVPEKCRKAKASFKTVCIVPGLVFDEMGYRLGYGKGYYDRFLQGFPGITVGFCYSGCVRWSLPHGLHDCKVDILVTENCTVKASG